MSQNIRDNNNFYGGIVCTWPDEGFGSGSVGPGESCLGPNGFPIGMHGATCGCDGQCYANIMGYESCYNQNYCGDTGIEEGYCCDLSCLPGAQDDGESNCCCIGGTIYTGSYSGGCLLGSSGICGTENAMGYYNCDNVSEQEWPESTSEWVCPCPYIVVGCMDPDADNYNPDANEDDGSCEYPSYCNIENYPDPLFFTACAEECDNDKMDIAPVGGDGILNVVDIVQYVNYIIGSTPSEPCILWAADVNEDGLLNVVDIVAVINQILSDVYGCTDSSADNYDPNATIDDGSCTYSGTGVDPGTSVDIEGCTDLEANNYNSMATIDDDSCFYQPPSGAIVGCTDPSAYNYNPQANWTTPLHDGICKNPMGDTSHVFWSWPGFPNHGLGDEIDGTLECCLYIGCTDQGFPGWDWKYFTGKTCNLTQPIDYPSAFNYNSDANINAGESDNGYCEYTGWVYEDWFNDFHAEPHG